MEVFSLNLDSPVKEIQVQGKLQVVLEDGRELCFTDSHEQDCCEQVFADWDTAKLYQYGEESLEGKGFNTLSIETIEKFGFKVRFTNSETDYYQYLLVVPCHNYQNGYYSSNLVLIFEDQKIDIGDGVPPYND